MKLSELHIHSLRNIQSSHLTLHPDFNVCYGDNGSGKTTLLEAIYLLSAGYSFKTRESLPLVRYGDTSLTVFARSDTGETVGLTKTISGPTLVKLNAQPCQNSSSLARFIPCQVFYQDIFNIIDAGPSVRRSLMDWGVFHVKHEYHDIWKRYRQVLKQRNALLRQRPSRQTILPWDCQLVSLSEDLDRLRKAYCREWIDVFQQYLTQLSSIECSIEYYRGWRDRGYGLDKILEDQFESDCQRQYTQSGAHQADIRISAMNTTAKQGFSRGQQKILLIALKLAQGQLLQKECIYLFDDMTSELDETHVRNLLQCLATVPGQKILTVLDPKALHALESCAEVAYFYVNKGVVTPMRPFPT